MCSSHRRILIGQHTYTPEESDAFARMSGDFNPIHLDPLFARRTLFGAPVVHGMHLVLSALDALCETFGETPFSIASLKADFLKPVSPGENVLFFRSAESEEACEIIGLVNEETVFGMGLSFTALPRRKGAQGALQAPALSVPRSRAWGEMEHGEGEISVALDTRIAMHLFPRAWRGVEHAILAEMTGISALVGMHCPGLHSILGGIHLRVEEPGVQDRLRYRVTRLDPRFSYVDLHVEGASISGSVKAYMRPPCVQQAGMEEIARYVASEAYRHCTALIIGGSRGLGELTAKIIAAGGGLPIITYYQGKDDAESVARSIREWGGECRLLYCDVNASFDAIGALRDECPALQSVYYFATPKIFRRKAMLFDYALFDEFNRYYVKAFGLLLDMLVQADPSKMRVFFPSTTAIDEALQELAEYSVSKRAGEDIGAIYQRRYPFLEVVTRRLPRLSTDQTASLMPVPAMDNVSILLPIIAAMES